MKLLNIDELGFVPLSKTGAGLSFELISQRYERGATLITSKAAISASSARCWPLPGNAVIGAAAFWPSFGPVAVRPSFPHPTSQHAFGQIQIPGCLRHRNAPICHQLHRLKLELLRELPSYHVQSPIPWSRSCLRVHETGSRP